MSDVRLWQHSGRYKELLLCKVYSLFRLPCSFPSLIHLGMALFLSLTTTAICRELRAREGFAFISCLRCLETTGGQLHETGCCSR
uniref:Uncharacterized protein n=1 Tax=Salvator merianae TaxID=96440 RepID=A0A8D0BZS9_SALMN